MVRVIASCECTTKQLSVYYVLELILYITPQGAVSRPYLDSTHFSELRGFNLSLDLRLRIDVIMLYSEAYMKSS